MGYGLFEICKNVGQGRLLDILMKLIFQGSIYTKKLVGIKLLLYCYIMIILLIVIVIVIALQGTNISPTKALLKMIFLFPFGGIC